jgi:hypothetical protein
MLQHAKLEQAAARQHARESGLTRSSCLHSNVGGAANKAVYTSTLLRQTGQRGGQLLAASDPCTYVCRNLKSLG